MSSFYGTGGNIIVNSNGSGADSSFTTLTGIESSPIVLNTLDYGNYLIKGYYTYTANDTDTKSVSYQMLVTIMEDNTTFCKVAKFETCEDGIFYIYIITFYDDETCLQDKQSFIKSEGIIFLSEADLPSTGVSDVLYVTETTIYQWSDNDQCYVDLGSPTWEDL